MDDAMELHPKYSPDPGGQAVNYINRSFKIFKVLYCQIASQSLKTLKFFRLRRD